MLDQAVYQARRAIEASRRQTVRSTGPLSQSCAETLAYTALAIAYSRRADAAVTQAQRAIGLNPRFPAGVR